MATAFVLCKGFWGRPHVCCCPSNLRHGCYSKHLARRFTPICSEVEHLLRQPCNKHAVPSVSMDSAPSQISRGCYLTPPCKPPPPCMKETLGGLTDCTYTRACDEHSLAPEHTHTKQKRNGKGCVAHPIPSDSRDPEMARVMYKSSRHISHCNCSFVINCPPSWTTGSSKKAGSFNNFNSSHCLWVGVVAHSAQPPLLHLGSWCVEAAK